jgi:hypothetical protein
MDRFKVVIGVVYIGFGFASPFLGLPWPFAIFQTAALIGLGSLKIFKGLENHVKS